MIAKTKMVFANSENFHLLAVAAAVIRKLRKAVGPEVKC